MSKSKETYYNAILIEDLESKFKLVIDHMKGVEERLDRKIDMRFDELSARLDLHGMLLQENTSRWGKNTSRWEENTIWQREAMRVLSQMNAGLERVENKLDHHEERITHLEDDVTALRSARPQ